MIKVVHAVEPYSFGDNITALYGKDFQNKVLSERIEHGQQLVAKTKQALECKVGTSIPIETNVIIGRAHHTIAQTAEDWKADMIVIGSHGRTGLNKFLLGSVSMSVLSHAPCSTAIVRLPAAPQQPVVEAHAKKDSKKPVASSKC